MSDGEEKFGEPPSLYKRMQRRKKGVEKVTEKRKRGALHLFEVPPVKFDDKGKVLPRLHAM